MKNRNQKPLTVPVAPTFFSAGLIALVWSCLLAPAPACFAQTEPELPEASEVIAEYIKATGGEEAHRAIKSLVATGTMGVPEAGIEGQVTVKQNEKCGVMIVELPGIGTERTGFDGETAWKVSEMTGPEILEGEQKTQLVAQMQLSPILSLDDTYESVKTTAREEFNGEQCYVVEAVNEGEHPVIHYFSVENGLHTGTRITAVTPMGNVEIVSKVGDYRDVNGVKMAFESHAVLPNSMTLESKMTKIEVNASIDEVEFELPAEIKELKDQQ